MTPEPLQIIFLSFTTIYYDFHVTEADIKSYDFVLA